MDTFFLFAHREFSSKKLLSWKLGRGPRRDNVVWIIHTVGKNMVILYSGTQPHPWPQQQRTTVSVNDIEHSTYMDGGFLSCPTFYNTHLLFRLLSRNHLARSLGSLMSLIVHRITLFIIYCVINYYDPLYYPKYCPEVFATPSVKVWLETSLYSHNSLNLLSMFFYASSFGWC